jgi:hypothetical protein
MTLLVLIKVMLQVEFSAYFFFCFACFSSTTT